MKKHYKLIFIFLVIAAISLSSMDGFAVKRKPYGVFTGINSDSLEILYKYEEVIIDAAYFSHEDIDLLHNNNVKVISYINIGSLEKFREYYNDYEDITLGEYENWPDERWIDVSQQRWQDLIVHDLGKNLSEKGVDGFFIDNAGVYSRFPQEGIFDGILEIIRGLKQNYEKKVIINGGFDFLKAALKNNIDLKGLIDGINRESVVTNIDFQTQTFFQRPGKDTKWALDNLESFNLHIPQIYIIEYSNNKKLDAKINSLYKNTGYRIYIARSIGLN